MKVASVHVDGSVTMWNCSEGEAICRLKLPGFTMHKLCVYVSAEMADGFFIAGKLPTIVYKLILAALTE